MEGVMAEVKESVDKQHVHFDASGHLVIKDPKVLKLLKDHGVKPNEDPQKAKSGIWVTVGT
jgi:hypothetical protein